MKNKIISTMITVLCTVIIGFTPGTALSYAIKGGDEKMQNPGIIKKLTSCRIVFSENERLFPLDPGIRVKCSW